MKKLLFGSSIFLSSVSFAYPHPQHIPLDNLAQFGSYMNQPGRIREIVNSTQELALAELVEGPGLLITTKVIINTSNYDVDAGKKPFATLELRDGSHICTRNIFSQVTADTSGENRILTFELAPKVRCRYQ